MIKRPVIGAHYGLRDWIAQRATAVIMALYSVVLIIMLLLVAPEEYGAWRGVFSNSFMKAATFLFFISLFWHAWIGMRDIWMDYIKPTWLRVILHVLTLAALIVYAGWAFKILWGLGV